MKTVALYTTELEQRHIKSLQQQRHQIRQHNWYHWPASSPLTNFWSLYTTEEESDKMWCK